MPQDIHTKVNVLKVLWKIDGAYAQGHVFWVCYAYGVTEVLGGVMIMNTFFNLKLFTSSAVSLLMEMWFWAVQCVFVGNTSNLTQHCKERTAVCNRHRPASSRCTWTLYSRQRLVLCGRLRFHRSLIIFPFRCFKSPSTHTLNLNWTRVCISSSMWHKKQVVF